MEGAGQPAGRRTVATVFTTGSVEYDKGADGVEIVRIDCAKESAGAYERVELPTGSRLETNGAIAESWGRGGPVYEVIALAELRLRGADETVLAPKATGSCTMTFDDHGLTTCASVSCSGTCVLKHWFIFSWCSCQ